MPWVCIVPKLPSVRLRAEIVATLDPTDALARQRLAAVSFSLDGFTVSGARVKGVAAAVGDGRIGVEVGNTGPNFAAAYSTGPDRHFTLGKSEFQTEPRTLKAEARHKGGPRNDQEGHGQEVAIPRGYRLRSVEAVQTWLAGRGNQRRSGVPRRGARGRVSDAALADDSTSRIVKRYARRVGLESPPTASVFKMTEVSRHRSLDTLRGDVRRIDLFREHAGAAFL